MIININGEIFSPEDAKIPVLDHGFLFGDSVYEVIRTANGRLFTATEHLERLRRSAEAVRLEVPLTNEQFIEEMRQSHEASGNEESYIRLILTRGAGEIDLHPQTCGRPNCIFIVKPLTVWPEEYYKQGVKVSLVSIHRNPSTALSPEIKSGNYLNNVIALMQAHDADAQEGIMLNPDGWVTEGTTSNIWIVREGTALTPSMKYGLLPGITREMIFEMARAGSASASEAQINGQDLLAAEEAFITSTTRGIMPVRQVDDKKIGSGQLGPVTQQLMSLLDERLQAN